MNEQNEADQTFPLQVPSGTSYVPANYSGQELRVIDSLLQDGNPPEARVEIAKPRSPAKATLKVPPQPKPNETCPCGSGKKFKRCCGSVRGDLVYFVAAGEEALMDEDGRVLIFENTAIAMAGARAKGWHDGEIIPLPPERFAKFKEAVPYVKVIMKDFDLSELDKPDEEKPKALVACTTLAGVMANAIAPRNS